MVRLFHDTNVKTATDVVDALVDRTLPVIWEVDGVKRVLNTRLSLTDRTLMLLYAEPGAISDKAAESFGRSGGRVVRPEARSQTSRPDLMGAVQGANQVPGTAARSSSQDR